jgi:hypothetical protein
MAEVTSMKRWRMQFHYCSCSAQAVELAIVHHGISENGQDYRVYGAVLYLDGALEYFIISFLYFALIRDLAAQLIGTV